MKKTILLVLSLVFCSALLSGCAKSGEPFTEKSYTPDTQICEIRLDVRDRAVEVSLSEDEQIHIQYSESSKAYYDLSVSDEAVLTMTSASSKSWTDYIGTKPAANNRKILLQIPDALLKDLTISTTNEDITLPSLRVTGGISLSSSGGDIVFEAVDVGTFLSLTAKNGDITGTIIGGYDDFSMQTNVKKGKNNLPERKDGGEKSLYVSSNNGDIDIAFAK